MYLVISIGNTDNKLTQQEWSNFVQEIDKVITEYGKVHFFGGASNWLPWQNVAWIIEVDNHRLSLDRRLEEIRKKYNQDSVFLMVGDGLFI